MWLVILLVRKIILLYEILDYCELGSGIVFWVSETAIKSIKSEAMYLLESLLFSLETLRN